jgi:hypothetical protein
VPETRAAITKIRSELVLVEQECPEMTPWEQLREARRRSVDALLAAIDTAARRSWCGCGVLLFEQRVADEQHVAH